MKSIKKKALLSTALAGFLLSGVQAFGGPSKSKNSVKCKGVATKWANDCGTNEHSCAGQATVNFHKEEWVYMDKSDCQAVKSALKNSAVRNYIEKVQNKTKAAVKRGKHKKSKKKS